MELELLRLNDKLNALTNNGLQGTTASAGRSYAAALTPPQQVSPRCPTTIPQANLDQYWRARASARLSPIEGETEAELMSNLQLFFAQKMKIPRGELSKKDIIHVRRVRVARDRRPHLEVIVKFGDVETRDRIASYARNLGELVDNGLPTATFRHEIPTFLSGVHKTFMQYGYAMSAKYGKGFKRNVRFDDITYSFCIDVRMPGANQNWITVSHERALKDLQATRRAEEKKNGDRLTSIGSAGDEDEAALGATSSSASACMAGAAMAAEGDVRGSGSTSSNNKNNNNKSTDDDWTLYR